jgi:hypothetical protein
MISRYDFASAGYMQPDPYHMEHGVSFVRSEKRYTNCPTHPTLSYESVLHDQGQCILTEALASSIDKEWKRTVPEYKR